MYAWFCSIPSWISFTIVISFSAGIAVGGIFVFRRFVSKWWEGNDNNDQISFYLSAVGVFYGITLGLLAAGAWQNFNDAEEKVNLEASAIAALYRDVKQLPTQDSTFLKATLKEYTHYVIHVAWPLHSKGIIHTDGTHILTKFQNKLYHYEPQTLREQSIFAEALRQFNRLAELRRQRLQTVTTGMTSAIWLVILVGAALTLLICWLFNIQSLRLHIIMNTITGIIIGSLIHLIIMLDSPYRGDVSISADSFQNVIDDYMK